MDARRHTVPSLTRRRMLAAAAGALPLLATLDPWPARVAAAEGDDEGSPLVVRLAAGADLAAIQAAVDLFRADLGTLNPNVAGSLPSGRREINWDGVPDAKSAPNPLPADFFNTTSPRGVVLFTPGTGFEVSANAKNPTNTAVRFGDINPAYPGLFQTCSPQRLFTALGSPVTEMRFFVPGSTTPASVRGFGAVFTDVVLPGSTRLAYVDSSGRLLGRFVVPASGPGGLSFLGVAFDDQLSPGRVARVRLVSGNAALSPNAVTGVATNVVAMDDFIYGEPQALAGDDSESIY